MSESVSASERTSDLKLAATQEGPKKAGKHKHAVRSDAVAVGESSRGRQ